MKISCPASAHQASARAVDRLGNPFPLRPLYTVLYTVQMRKATDTSLSRERILGVALEVIERDGLGALSMRRLAQELDVWPMSLYTYFRDKEELLDAIAARAAGAVVLPDDAESWRERLRALLHAVAGNPAAGDLARAFLTPEALRLSEAALTILDEAGFPRADAVSAWRALWAYTYGFATFRVAPTAAEARRRTRTAIAALPDEDYPALLAAAAEMSASLADDDEFDRGLDRLLDGIEARVELRDHA
jgi:AcrR family transcriptional regulator